MPQPKSINLLVLCQPSTISVKHPAQNFLSIARKLDLRTQVPKQLGRGGQEEEFARSLPYPLALHMRVCLEKRKACETDATPCVCLLSPFKIKTDMRFRSISVKGVYNGEPAITPIQMSTHILSITYQNLSTLETIQYDTFFVCIVQVQLTKMNRMRMF